MSTDRICKDCKHYDLFRVTWFCDRVPFCKKLERTVTDLVTGKEIVRRTLCAEARSLVGDCGKAGELWESKTKEVSHAS